MVVDDPERRQFVMARPVANQEESLEYEYGFVPLNTAKWDLPEEFELTTENSDPVEVFRFYPDGGASGTSLNLGCQGHSVMIGVAKLTGAVITYDGGEGQQ